MIPNELRLGNYVQFDNDTFTDRFEKAGVNVFKVNLISEGLVKIDIGFGAAQRFEIEPVFSPQLEDLKPIPLTEEWLLKFGFRESNKYLFKYKLGLKKRGDNYFYDNISIKHVHQLQNLYFALTGEELTLKQ